MNRRDKSLLERLRVARKRLLKLEHRKATQAYIKARTRLRALERTYSHRSKTKN